MKTLPGLPALPPGYWWEIYPCTTNDGFKVQLMTWQTLGQSTLPKTLGTEYTRGWPRPTARTIVRTAKVIHNRWLAQTSREASAFTGKFQGSQR